MVFKLVQNRFTFQYVACRRTCSTMSSSNSPSSRAIPMSKKAGVVVVGDEILNGQTEDTNSGYIFRRLNSMGITTVKMSTIGDDLSEIAATVKEFSECFGIVLVCGGIGPTADDMTYDGVAKAFEDTVLINSEMDSCLRDEFKERYNENVQRMAAIPSTSKLLYGDDGSMFPTVVVKNVYLLPGVPMYLKKAFKRLEGVFNENTFATSYTRDSLYLSIDEVSMSVPYSEICSKYESVVTFGSYPDWTNSHYKVRISLSGEKSQSVLEAKSEITRAFPNHLIYYSEKVEDQKNKHITTAITDHEIDAAEKHGVSKNVYHASIQDGSQLKLPLSNALSVIEKGLHQYGSETEKVCIAFNGGKDCTALLHLVLATLGKTQASSDDANHTSTTRLQALYIRSSDAFPEVDEFVEWCRQYYNLDLIELHGPIKTVLANLKEQRPKIEAIFMGSRSTDPGCHDLNPFQLTDPGWPSYMRVNPIIDWSYSDVWAFLRRLCLPYCGLYDIGYTSLGSVSSTHPNPRLRGRGRDGALRWRPAYQLVAGEEHTEREGRH